MLPALPPGTRLAVSPLTRPPRRGQVVLVRHPDPGRDLELVKRVVGLPGERVRLDGATVRIDGRVLAEPYASPWGSQGTLDLTLGPDEYLVLGDRRAASSDGRSFGPVRREHLLAAARFAYWPPSAWRAPLRAPTARHGWRRAVKRQPRAQANEAAERVEW